MFSFFSDRFERGMTLPESSEMHCRISGLFPQYRVRVNCK